MQISTIGLDIAKNVFQVHGIDAAEKVVVRKRFRRRQVLEFFKALPPCAKAISSNAESFVRAEMGAPDDFSMVFSSM